jgi:phosphatidylglycerol:prolipoprotein diacylglycerol transferase
MKGLNMDRVLFTIGPITIYWYSVTMLLAVIIGIILATRESKKHAMESFMADLITYVLIFGIIGARLYYVIFNFDNYKHNLLSILKIWEGGIAIYGALIGGFIAIVYLAKKRGQSIIKTTDIIVPGLILAQSIGRWGNFFNGEAHGTIVTLEFLKSLHIPNFIIEGMYINGSYYHPTFLYESIWCLLGFIFLIILRKITKRRKGIMTFSYFIWYGIGRLFIEGLRTDSLYLGNYRISQIVSIILIIVGIIGIIISAVKGNKDERNL